MKFRFILLNPDNDPDHCPGLQKDVTAASTSPSNALRYAIRDGEMVRRIQSSSGRWSRAAVANFTARILTDIVRDDGTEESRELTGCVEPFPRQIGRAHV